MQVHQMIRNSADILTITTLAPGNVYKRVDSRAFGESEPTLRFGVVQDVMNNGEDSAITALEFTADYSGVAAQLKVYDGAKPVVIFPATPEEITTHLAEVQQRAQKDVERAEQTLAKERVALEQVQRIIDGIGALSAPESTDTPVLVGSTTDDESEAI